MLIIKMNKVETSAPRPKEWVCTVHSSEGDDSRVRSEASRCSGVSSHRRGRGRKWRSFSSDRRSSSSADSSRLDRSSSLQRHKATHKPLRDHKRAKSFESD